MSSTNDARLRGYCCALHLACALAAVALAWGGWRLVDQPITQRKRDLACQIEQSFDLARDAAELRRQHEALRAGTTELSQRVTDLDARMTCLTHPSQWFEQLTELSQRTSVSVNDYRPRHIQDRGPVRQHLVQLAISGDYENVCRFLVELEGLPVLCKVTQLKILGGQAGGAGLSMELGLCWSAAVATVQTP